MKVLGPKEYSDLFQIKKVLGKGYYGTVYEVVNTLDGKTYALKTTAISKTKEKKLTSLYRDLEYEFKIVSNIHSENIVKYYDMFVVLNKGGYILCLVMEYIRGVNLFDVSECMLTTGYRLNPLEIYLFFKKMLEIIKLLHDRGVSHGDIKLENVIMVSGDEGRFVFVDFGFACFTPCRYIPKSSYPSYENCKIGPRPETVPTGMAFSNDLWALGIMVIKMIVPFYKPYPEASSDDDFYIECPYILTQEPSIPSSIIRSVLSKCFYMGKGPRPTVDDILEALSKIRMPTSFRAVIP